MQTRSLAVFALLIACESAPPKTQARPTAMLLDHVAPPPASGSAQASVGGCPKGTVLVPGGTLERKPTEAREGFSTPPTAPVDVGAFCMDKTEVTAGAYRRCVIGEGCTLEHTDVYLPNADARQRGLFSLFCNAQKIDRLEHPMNCVDLMQAQAYCRWVRGRLPTEDEWEWAARGRDEARVYPWGDAEPGEKLLNACGAECSKAFDIEGAAHRTMYPGDDGFPGTAPVGSFPGGASRDGILDLAGNVFEWTSTTTTPNIAVDRGGAWSNASFDAAKASSRHTFNTGFRDSSLGFRCVSDKK